MRVVIFQFKQETNSFSPVTCGMEMFKSTLFAEGREMLCRSDGQTAGLSYQIKELKKADIEVIPSVALCSISSGPVTREVADYAADKLIAAIKKHAPVDGVLMCLHGATQLADFPDGAGFFITKAREAAGEKAVIAASFDYHANITQEMVKGADIVCGYKTYPHIDKEETAQRAACLAIDLILKKKMVFMTHIKLPMIHQAEACLTTEGPMKEMIELANSCEKDGVYDVSIFQMQPWLDVAEGGASVVVIADSQKKAEETAEFLAKRYWDIRKRLTYKLYELDAVIDTALKTQDKPVIVSDSADSPSAGSPGDSTAILSRLLQRGLQDTKAYITIVDPDGVRLAINTGIGGTAEFTLGGMFDKRYAKPVTFTGYVKSLHDGSFIAQNKYSYNMGDTAVLKIAQIHIIVASRPVACYYPEIYRSMGLDPINASLVVVKSAIMYREYYKEISDLMYTVDTPGASSANLGLFEYKNIPRPMYPFDNIDEYCPISRTAGHTRIEIEE